MKTAILLCAGMGSRLVPLTNEKPKPLIEINGTPILQNTLQLLEKHGIKHLVVVLGYKKEKIIHFLKNYENSFKIDFIENEKWQTTNNIYSLWLAKQYLGQEPVLLVEGDVYLTENALSGLTVIDNISKLLVSPLRPEYDGTCVYLDEEQNLLAFTNNSLTTDGPIKYKTVNLYALTTELGAKYQQKLDEMVKKGQLDAYYEDALKLLPDLQMKGVILNNSDWFEVDSTYDLATANYLFAKDKHTIAKQMHGGYWRLPMQDHALIYNFHFPPHKLINQLKANFEQILLNYPATSIRIEKHLSYALNIPAEQLVIANGVSEMIKVLPQLIAGQFLLLEPSFNEYRNCLEEDRVTIVQMTAEENFKVTAKKLLPYLEKQAYQALVLITPDNPSGQIIDVEDIEEIYQKTEEQGTIIILDESFIDFSSQAEQLTFERKMAKYPRMLLVKSMSKTYGIGGLRLGYAVTSNNALRKRLKALLPIWNINGFAEEFIMQLAPYMKAYRQSCKQVRQETDKLYEQLKEIPELDVLETHANFLLCKIKNNFVTADAFAERLLHEKNIYIKECSGKELKDAAYYLRISSRTEKENNVLVESLKDIFKTFH